MAGAQTPVDYFRFCPGEEHIKISGAICRGRRHVHFPKCHGCQFNDDEKAAAAAGDAPSETPVPTILPVSVFRHSDVLGAYPDPLSPDLAWRIGHATAQFLHGRLRGLDRADPAVRKMIVGRDSRQSSVVLESSLIEGIQSSGLDVVRIGVVDTPQLYFAVNHLGACGGVHVTGGRHPPSHNGFRICAAKASPVSAETGLPGIRDMASRVPRHQTGSLGTVATHDLADAYVAFLRSALRTQHADGRPLRLVAAACGSVAATLLPAIFHGIPGLSLNVIDAESGISGNHDPNESAVVVKLRKAINQHRADLGVGFDGSGVRCLFADEKGQVVPADLVAALLARRFIEREPGAAVVYDHRFSRSVAEEVERAGGTGVPQRPGSVHVKKAMGERKAVFGADLGGRFYFRNSFYCENAFLPVLHLLDMLRGSDRKMSELVRAIQHYRSSGEVRIPCADVRRVMNELPARHTEARIERIDGVTVQYPDWWFNVRQSLSSDDLELVLEARTRKLVEQRLREIAPQLGTSE